MRQVMWEAVAVAMVGALHGEMHGGDFCDEKTCPKRAMAERILAELAEVLTRDR